MRGSCCDQAHNCDGDIFREAIPANVKTHKVAKLEAHFTALKLRFRLLATAGGRLLIPLTRLGEGEPSPVGLNGKVESPVGCERTDDGVELKRGY